MAMSLHRVVIAAVVLALMQAPGASAHDHRRPPSPRLKAGGEVQEGKNVRMTWLRRYDEKYCDLLDGFGYTTFPKRVLSYDAGDTARVRLKKSAPPLEWWVYAWEDIRRKNGQPKGTAQVIPAAVDAHRRDGQVVAWDIRFVLPPADRHLYILVEAYWADEEGCSSQPDLGSQSAAWSFHLSRR